MFYVCCLFPTQTRTRCVANFFPDMFAIAVAAVAGVTMAATALINKYEAVSKDVKSARSVLEKAKHICCFNDLQTITQMDGGWFYQDSKLNNYERWSLAKTKEKLQDQEFEWISDGNYKITNSIYRDEDFIPSRGVRIYVAWKVGMYLFIWIKEGKHKYWPSTFDVIDTRGESYDLPSILKCFHFTEPCEE